MAARLVSGPSQTSFAAPLLRLCAIRPSPVECAPNRRRKQAQPGSISTREGGPAETRKARYRVADLRQRLAEPAFPAHRGYNAATQTGTNYYFGNKLIKNANGYVGADRLGSNRNCFSGEPLSPLVLVMTKCGHGIQSCRTPRWNIAGQESCADQQ